MASGKLSERDIAAIRGLAKQWGKIVVRRAFGESGPGLDVDFNAMEELAVAAAQGLTEGTLEEATTLQAEALTDEQPCPDCGEVCGVGAHQEARSIVVRGGGSFEHREPVCYCRRCRRSFFPSAIGSETGRARL